MSVNSKMTALADEIRELSGTTTPKGIDAMTTDVNAANTEINEQMDLIAQISSALENKAAGGVALPTLNNPAAASDILSGKEAIDGDGNKMTGTISTKTSSNLTASGATVTVPAGYYASQATKTISSGSAKTPATTVTKNPSISVSSSGLITASVSGTQNVTPTVTAGYVSSGTAGTITVSGSATKQLTTQAAKTVTPSTSSQTAVASGVYTTGAITVAAIPSNYEDVGTETTEYTSLNAELEEVINSLPDAGGGESGGGVETCGISFHISGGGRYTTCRCSQYNDTTGKIEYVSKSIRSDGYTTNLSSEKFVKGTLVCFSMDNVSEIQGDGITVVTIPEQDSGQWTLFAINNDAPDVISVSLIPY